MIQDLTVGKPRKVIFSFALPMLFSMMFQQIYSIADSIIAGRFVSEEALAAVGASAPIVNLFIAVASGLCIGCSVIVAQLFGKRHYAKLRSAIRTSILAVSGLSVLFLIVGVMSVKPLMRLLKTPDNIFADSVLYLQIYAWGMVFLFLYNAANAIFTGLGDSKTPLFFLIFSSVLNIGLDILFVTVFHMGVAGVAWATLIAQGVAGICSITALIYRVRKDITPEHAFAPFDTHAFREIMHIGIPSILQQSLVSLGQLFVQSLINSYGSDVVAGFTAGFKLNIFCITAVSTFGSALSSYCAQNAGSGRNGRVIRGTKATLVMGLGVSAVFMAAFYWAGEPLIKLFVGPASDNSHIVTAGTQFLKVVSAFYLIIPFKLVLDGTLRGVGKMKGFLAGTLTELVFRVAFSFVLAPIFGYMGIWYAWPIGWIAGTAVVLLFYFFEYRKLKQTDLLLPRRT